MSLRSIGLDDRLQAYLLGASLREPGVLRRLRDETAGRDDAEMQIAPEQGQLMALLARAIGARRTLDVGVFTGYSSIAVALALPPDGRVVALDVSEEYGRIARRWWDEAGVAEKIEFRLGPAVESLDALLAEGQAGTFDFAFLDAAKNEYPAYWERCLRLVRPGGLILVDNTLKEGRVADPEDREPVVERVREFNAMVHRDERVELAMLPVADGLTVGLVR